MFLFVKTAAEVFSPEKCLQVFVLMFLPQFVFVDFYLEVVATKREF